MPIPAMNFAIFSKPITITNSTPQSEFENTIDTIRKEIYGKEPDFNKSGLFLKDLEGISNIEPKITTSSVGIPGSRPGFPKFVSGKTDLSVTFTAINNSHNQSIIKHHFNNPIKENLRLEITGQTYVYYGCFITTSTFDLEEVLTIELSADYMVLE